MPKDTIVLLSDEPPAEIPQNTDPSNIIIYKKILDNGSFETKYGDGRIEQRYIGGFTIIYPDGRISQLAAMSVPALVPPVIPNSDLNKWLNSLDESLLSLISQWLGNDKTSLANISKTETSKNIYETVNRKLSIIDFLNPKKK